MSGIYIHIPFCRQRCYYCDFYSTTQLKRKPDLVAAISKELVNRKDWLAKEEVNTIYFGGGTPSLLSTDDLNQIFDTIYKHFIIAEKPEITFEANPDDLTQKQINHIKNTQINRLSIGIQSFIDADLQLMNRRHSAQNALKVVQDCQNAGFDNISIDLIYGLPQSTIESWESNLNQAAKLNIQHLSAYHLTIEPNTVFYAKQKKGELLPIADEKSVEQFKALIFWAKNNDFLHYEISNFGKEGMFSQHNTSYWMQQKYLGVGPSAHSYNVLTRSWNVANLGKYIEGIENNEVVFEQEELSENDKHNEFLITGLRTKWGVNLNEFEHQFGLDTTKELLLKADKFIQKEKLYINNNALTLTDEGVFISDAILAELMKVVNDD